jgi:hypothetical protein
MSDLGMSTTIDVTKCKECGVLASQNNTINKTVDEQTFKTQKDAQPNQQTSDLGTRSVQTKVKLQNRRTRFYFLA